MSIRTDSDGVVSNSVGCGIRQRYVLAVMAFLGLANGYIQRFCLSLAITQMVIQKHQHHQSTEKSEEYCPSDFQTSDNGTVVIHKPVGEFNWDEATQGLILSSFFWGYVVMQVPGGLLAERLNAKITLLIGILASSLGTLVTPVVSRSLGPYGLIVTRLFIGLGQGPMYPSLNVLLSKWAPLTEKQRLGALVFAGAQIGNVISMAVSGMLITWSGWTTLFYTFGTVGIVWSLIWYFLCSNSPADNPYISDVELKYIQQNSNNVDRGNIPPTPWLSILQSVPFWGLVIAQVGHDWGLFTIITDLPKYMNSVLHFSVKENGFWSAVPYLVMWLFAMACGWAMDHLISVRKFNQSIVKKSFISIAALGPAIGILAATYAGCNKILVAVCFSIGMGLMGAFLPSLKVNPLDLSPNYAGTLMALVGGMGAISGIITPYLVGLLTTNNSMSEWRLVFWISVAVLVGTNTMYLFMGSAEVQPWNDPGGVIKNGGKSTENENKTSNGSENSK